MFFWTVDIHYGYFVPESQLVESVVMDFCYFGDIVGTDWTQQFYTRAFM